MSDKKMVLYNTGFGLVMGEPPILIILGLILTEILCEKEHEKDRTKEITNKYL
jgi:hypothetical protein